MKPRDLIPSNLPLPLHLVAIGLALAGTAGAQTTWYVDDDAPNDPGPGNPFISDLLEDGSAAHPFDRIQEAIDAAAVGDEVLVLAGTYFDFDTIDVSGAGASKELTIRSTDGPAVTTIDAIDFYAHVMKADSGESAAMIIDGFRMIGGEALVSSNLQDRGAGLLLWNSNATVRNCIFEDNEAVFGGGLYASNSSSSIEGCTFLQNSSTTSGGGVYLNASIITLSNCTFEQNDAGAGGGTYTYNTNTTIVDCTYLDNTCAASGAGLHKWTSSPLTVVRTRFIGNEAGTLGGGAFANSGGSFQDCLFVDNVSSSDEGGGLACYNSGTLKVLSSTFYGNQGYGAFEVAGGNLVMANTIVWASLPAETFGATLNFSHVMGVDDDPLFVDPDGDDNILGTLDDDLRLTEDSPCIDAGDTLELTAQSASTPYPVDLARRPRVVNVRARPDAGRAALGLVVDIGAFEYPEVCPAANVVHFP